MEIHKLLAEDVQAFIHQHEQDDENTLLLKHKELFGITSSLVANQLSGRRKVKLKLPTWYKAEQMLYPPSLNLEQCSSEATANYKVEILKKNLSSDFTRAVDLTGGFGVDSFFLSSAFKEVDYVEPDENLFEMVKHNLTTLLAARSKKQKERIQFHNSTAEDFLASTKEKYDLIYIDPSRRSKGNQKVFRLADCVPDITALQDIIFERTKAILLKASPMFDLQRGIKELKNVAKIFVVAVDNECKEVLFLCKEDHDSEPEIEAIDLKSDLSKATSPFSFFLSDEKKVTSGFSNPLLYLYEPNAALLKAGAFKLIANRFDVKKLHQHTHLYTSDKVVAGFPGKIFEIEALIKADTKTVRPYFPEGKANVAIRNYPLSAEGLKQKTSLKDGGEKFLIGFSGPVEKFTAVCKRISTLNLLTNI